MAITILRLRTTSCSTSSYSIRPNRSALRCGTFSKTIEASPTLTARPGDWQIRDPESKGRSALRLPCARCGKAPHWEGADLGRIPAMEKRVEGIASGSPRVRVRVRCTQIPWAYSGPMVSRPAETDDVGFTVGRSYPSGEDASSQIRR